MSSLFGVNVDLKPLAAKTQEFISQQTLIIALLQENNKHLQEIKEILKNN
jgi:hypothetical protein